MIQGRIDTYFTIDEFSAMVGREPKTIKNWAAKGELRFVHLLGVPLVSLALVEQLIDGYQAVGDESGQVALRMMNARPRTSPPVAHTAR